MSGRMSLEAEMEASVGILCAHRMWLKMSCTGGRGGTGRCWVGGDLCAHRMWLKMCCTGGKGGTGRCRVGGDLVCPQDVAAHSLWGQTHTAYWYILR